MAKQTQKPAKLTKPAAAAQAVRDVTGPTTLTELVETAYGLFTDAGGKCEKGHDAFRVQGRDSIRRDVRLGHGEAERNHYRSLRREPVRP